MGKFLILSLLLAVFSGCASNTELVVGEKTTMTVDRIFDAKEVMKGEVVTAKFKVTNTGEYPLILASVKPACSCTVSSYPKEPIMPGESEWITASVNTDHLSTGVLAKHVTVTSNTVPSVTKLKIKGQIMSK